MEGKDLLKLTLGERLVTVARLLAAEHVRQELDHTRSEQTPGQHVPTLTQLADPADPIQQYRYQQIVRPAAAGAGRAAPGREAA